MLDVPGGNPGSPGTLKYAELATARHECQDPCELRPTKNGATIVDIARKLGLSAMTVSRALNRHTEVSRQTSERVLACAKAMGYQPNRWARSLVTRRSLMIGVVVPDLGHSFFTEIASGIEEIVEKAGYDILLCHSRGDAARELAEVQVLIGSRVDGLIIAPVQPEDSENPFSQLLERNIPVVLVDRFFPRGDLPCVRVDDLRVGRLATGHLIELGHRRIGHISGPSSSGSLRGRGFANAMRAAGLALDKRLIVAGDFQIDGGREAMKALLKLKPRPTAVFAANDPLAIGAVYSCREAGLHVPNDISIVGAGNIEGPHHPNPFLTTVDWPRQELGRVAAEILLDRIGKLEPVKPEVRVFKPELLVRQSSAAPSSK
jgi:LacI family transcriptional regulator